MDMKSSIRAASSVLLVVALTTWSAAQLENSIYDPASRPASSKQKSGLFDFALKRINPSDFDYGKRLTEDRSLLFEGTVVNRYFWSNAIAIGLLVCLFTVIVFQHQTHVRQEEATAEMLAQYEYALSRALEQTEFATRNNRSLKEVLVALRESVLRGQVSPPDLVERATSPAVKKERPLSVQPPTQERSVNAAPKPSRELLACVSSPATDIRDQMRLFTPDADLVMRVNSLEQQLSQSQEDNKQLRRRITEGDRRLSAEQAKNRQLKGA